jgi:hypothetical protein
VTPPYYPSSANAELCTIPTGVVNELHLDKEGIFPLQALRLPEEDLEEDYTEAVLDDTYKKEAIHFVVRRTTHNKMSKYSNMQNATRMLKRVHPIQGTSGFCPGSSKNTLHHIQSLYPSKPTVAQIDHEIRQLISWLHINLKKRGRCEGNISRKIL